MKNIRKFKTASDMVNAVKYWVNVSYNTETNGLSSIIDYSLIHATFKALGDGSFSFSKKGDGDDIQYSKDNGYTWTVLPSGESVSVSYGDKVMWKSTIAPKIGSGIGTFSSTCGFKAFGNVMSLLYGDGFRGQVDLTEKKQAFCNLFNKCVNLVDASNLILPAITLSRNCYSGMFEGCKNLTTAPELPATTLADYCYNNMFYNCSNLKKSPELPATTLAPHCYSYMFHMCTKMTEGPSVLPATTLASGCYVFMFYQCIKLAKAPSVLPATTLADNCYRGMFYFCTSLTTAPELPAAKLVDGCYYMMLYHCTGLERIKMLATDVSASECLSFWVAGMPSTGVFVKHPDMDSLPTGADGIPEGWTVKDAVI